MELQTPQETLFRPEIDILLREEAPVRRDFAIQDTPILAPRSDSAAGTNSPSGHRPDRFGRWTSLQETAPRPEAGLDASVGFGRSIEDFMLERRTETSVPFAFRARGAPSSRNRIFQPENAHTPFDQAPVLEAEVDFAAVRNLQPVESPTSKIAPFFKELLRGDPEIEPLVRPYRKKIWMARALLIVVGLAGVLATRLRGEIYDAFIATDPVLAGWIAGAMILTSLAIAIAKFFYDRVLLSTDANLSYDVRSRFYAHLLAQPSSVFEKNSPSELSARSVNDIGKIPVKNVHSRISFLYYLVMLVVTTGFMIATSWELTAAAAALTPLLLWISIRYGKKREANESDLAAKQAAIVEAFEEGLSREREAKIIGAAQAQTEKFQDAAGRYRVSFIDNVRLITRYTLYFGQLSMISSHFAVIILGGFAHIFWGAEFITIGGIMAMAGFAATLRGAFQGLVGLYTNNRASGGRTRKVLDLLASSSALELPESPQEVPALSRTLTFRNVNQTDETGLLFLDDADLVFRKGEHTAVVHAGGADLSTLTALLLRLKDPDGGALFYDEIPYRQADLPLLRRAVGLLDRESTLLPGTLRENFAFVHPGVTDDEIVAALSLAKAEFVLQSKRFPSGLDTPFEDIRDSLSEGEKRLLLLARLQIQNPAVVVLDGAGHGLDGWESYLFNSTLRKILAGRTVISLWPRITELSRADHVLVLQNGKVAEQGTHEELLERDGPYRELLDTIRNL